MELETIIKCSGLNYSTKSRLSLVDLNDMPDGLTDNTEKFSVRITMIGRCKKLQGENRCNLNDKKCIFGDLQPIERIDLEDDEFEDDEFFVRTDY